MSLKQYQIEAIKNTLLEKINKSIDTINNHLAKINKQEIKQYKRDLLEKDERIIQSKVLSKLLDKRETITTQIYEVRHKIHEINDSQGNCFLPTSDCTRKENSRFIKENSRFINDYVKRTVNRKFFITNYNNHIQDFIIVEDVFGKKKSTIDELADKLLMKILKKNDENK